MMPPVIDSFIPQVDLRKRHDIVVRAPAELVFDVASDFEMRSIPQIHAIFWLREKLLRAEINVYAPRGLIEEALSLGWGILAAESGRLFIAGAVCQPWQSNVTFTAVPSSKFAAYAKPGLVKIAWSLEVQSLSPEVTRLVTETRVVATDDEARAKFRRYWLMFGAGSMVIRRLLLRGVRRRAEALWQSQRACCSN